MPGALRGQKRILNLLELELQIDGCELPSRCWEPNSGPLQEQQERMDMYRVGLQRCLQWVEGETIYMSSYRDDHTHPEHVLSAHYVYSTMTMATLLSSGTDK